MNEFTSEDDKFSNAPAIVFGKYSLVILPPETCEIALTWESFAELGKSHVYTTYHQARYIIFAGHGHHDRSGINDEQPRDHFLCSSSYRRDFTPLGAEDDEKPKCLKCEKAAARFDESLKINPELRTVRAQRKFALLEISPQNFNHNKVDRLASDVGIWWLEKKPGQKEEFAVKDNFVTRTAPLLASTALVFQIPEEDLNVTDAILLWQLAGFEVVKQRGRKKRKVSKRSVCAVPAAGQPLVTRIVEEIQTNDPKERVFIIESEERIHNTAGSKCHLSEQKNEFVEMLEWLKKNRIRLTDSEKRIVTQEKIAELQKVFLNFTGSEWELLIYLFDEFGKL
jgi:hypothetical protein